MKYIAKFAFTAVLTAASLIASAQIKMTQSQKLKIAEMAVNEYYVDTVNEEKLVEDAIRGMLNELDPHSSYSTPEETKDLNEPLDGNFSGIGIQFNMKNDTLYVLQTIAGGPSERVGIVAGDRIIAANDTAIAGVKMKNSDIMKRLRGPKGTKVEVTVLRRNQPEPIRFRITRDDIPLFSVDAAYMIDSKTGYIRLSRFAKTSYDEVMDAATKLKKQGMKQLIFDISDNGGGYLEIATQIANDCVHRGPTLATTRRARQRPRKSPRHRSGGSCQPIFCFGQRNPLRRHPGLGPRRGCGPTHFRKRPGATPVPVPRWLDDSSHHFAILYPFGPMYSETLWQEP